MLATDSADAAIVQDLLLPLDTSEAFVEYIDKELNIWPLWICPVRKKSNAKEVPGWPFHRTEDDSATKDEKGDLTLNFGVWGPTDPTPAVVRKTNRDLKEKLRELRGMKVPYAEFWDLYDRQKYNALRTKWHAEALPNMYDKVRRKHQVKEIEDDGPTHGPTKRKWKERILQT
jgi:delta24-sterol reductase